ncbi:hypothetical protein A2J03_19230 [Rhodococcus sp. EPR-157]|uniref:DUF1707 SHOCT-like domain-containing protein n=1 Tax=Rhodococcus sp. EPR-157 TaxID=1813677 RepID=UPI0007BB0A41|nr:DUF1707 domain-containing protein [Rhodococcus sp. EPR-157]KZF11581.1 hypothetical protein A2J03_19230 [Rhodococcus sp. EPR-157]
MTYQPMSGGAAPSTRLSDAQRESAVDRLTGHVASGRLALDDFDARARQIYAAVTLADLESIFCDLPAAGPRAAAEKPTSKQLPMARELLTWAAVGVLCLSIWAITSIATGNFLYPWPVWVIGPWGAMLALQRVTGVSMTCSGRRLYVD